MKTQPNCKAILGFLLVTSSLSAQMTALQAWTFEDADGTPLSSTTNSAGDWSYNTSLDSHLTVIGGVLQLSNFVHEIPAETALFLNSNGTGTDITSGTQFELSFDVPALDFSGATTYGTYFGVELLGETNQVIGSVRFTNTAGEIKVRMSRNAAFDTTIATEKSLPSAGIRVTFSVDLSAGTIGTYTVSVTGGADITPFTTDVLDLMVDPAAGLGGIKFSAFNGVATTLAPTDYIQIDNLTLSGGAAVEPTTWRGYPTELVDGNLWADTGDWMGWVYVQDAPIVYVLDLDNWAFIAAEDAPAGSWLYFFR